MFSLVRVTFVAISAYIAAISPAFAGVVVNQVPEPATLALFAVGAGAVALAKFRNRK